MGVMDSIAANRAAVRLAKAKCQRTTARGDAAAKSCMAGSTFGCCPHADNPNCILPDYARWPRSRSPINPGCSVYGHYGACCRF